MKYRELTKDQFESLHEEFARFLASQQIDAKEWEHIKSNKPAVAQQEMEVFSDVVWDDVLTRVAYIEHYSKSFINLFKCEQSHMERIVIQVSGSVDLTSSEGYQWLVKHPNDPKVDVLTGKKKYSQERNTELFSLIEKGGVISKGELFEFFANLIAS